MAVNLLTRPLATPFEPLGFLSRRIRMSAATQINHDWRAPAFVGVVLFLGLFLNALETKRIMCHDTGRSFEAAQFANMLRH